MQAATIQYHRTVSYPTAWYAASWGWSKQDKMWQNLENGFIIYFTINLPRGYVLHNITHKCNDLLELISIFEILKLLASDT